MGLLGDIYSTLPWWRLDAEAKSNSIERSRIHGFPYVTGVRRAARVLLRGAAPVDEKLAVLDTKIFSRWLATKIKDVDAFIGISGTGLHAGRKVKSQGGVYVMDRGSAHIRESNDILDREYKRWGHEWRPINSWLMENEDRESEEADLITVPSEFVARTFYARGVDRTKVRVIPYGVNLKEFYPADDFEARRVTHQFNLLFVGNFSIRKGAGYLLEAMRLLQKDKVQLTVVGNIPDETQQLINKLGSERITFKGVVPRSEVRQYMSQADALVLPSVEEGLALVQAQALACGCPVIATPNTGSESLFRHLQEGLIIDPYDSASIVAAVRQLHGSPELLLKMRVAGVAMTAQLGGWRNYADGIVNAIRSVR